MHPVAPRPSDSEILALSPEALVPLLYDRLLEHLDGALDAIAARAVEAKSHHLERALAIVMELMASLDLERGEELAPRLQALYAYFASEILAIGRSLDAELLRRIREMIAGLRESWAEAARRTAPGEAHAPARRTLAVAHPT
jgi:flagellar secretion chaperone FliS